MRRHTLAALVAAILLAACVSIGPSRRDVVVIRSPGPPPAPRVEQPPPPPSPESSWVSGHWALENGGFVWHGGRWLEPRPDAVYVQAYWARSPDGWVFHPARWKAVATAGIDVATVSGPPPAPRIEAITPPPGIEFIWIAGHWRFERGQYVWAPGHWERRREAEQWVPAHWLHRGPTWQYVPGRWED